MTSTEDLLRLASETLLAHFASYCEGAVIVDDQARVVWMNDRYPARLGISLRPETVVGRPIEEVIPNSLMRQVVESGQPIMLDLMEYRDDAFVVTRLPLRDAAGQVVGAVGFMLYDDPRSLTPLIARYRRLSADLAEAERRLAAERRTRYTFASFVGNGSACTEVKRAGRRAARSAGADPR